MRFRLPLISSDWIRIFATTMKIFQLKTLQIRVCLTSMFYTSKKRQYTFHVFSCKHSFKLNNSRGYSMILTFQKIRKYWHGEIKPILRQTEKLKLSVLFRRARTTQLFEIFWLRLKDILSISHCVCLLASEGTRNVKIIESPLNIPCVTYQRDVGILYSLCR